MSIYLAAPVGLLCAVLQSSLMPRIQLLGATPNLVLVVLVLWVLEQGMPEGFTLGLVAGISLDTLSSGPFGTAIVGLLLVTLSTGLGVANVFKNAWYLPYFTILTATLLYGLIQVLALQAVGRPVSLGNALLEVFLPETAANVVLMVLGHQTVRLLRRRHAADQVG